MDFLLEGRGGYVGLSLLESLQLVSTSGRLDIPSEKNRTATYTASDSATTFSKAVSALRAAMPRVPLLSLASLSRTKSFFCSLSWRTCLNDRTAAYPSLALIPLERTNRVSKFVQG